MTVQIDFVEIAIPTRTRSDKGAKKGSKYPIADIVAGSQKALLVKLEEGDDIEKLQARLASATNTFRASGNKQAKFLIRQVEHESVQAVAVWRLADRNLTDEAVEEVEVSEEV